MSAQTGKTEIVKVELVLRVHEQMDHPSKWDWAALLDETPDHIVSVKTTDLAEEP